MNKKRTLIIPAVVVTLLSFMINCSCATFAQGNEGEKELINQIKVGKQNNLDDLHKTLKLYILDSELSSTFRIHCLSIVMKNFNGERLADIIEALPEDLDLYDVENSSYANFLYRSVCLLNKEKLPQVKSFLEEVVDAGKNFLLTNKFNFSKFRNYSCKYQINLLKSVDVMKQNLMFDNNELTSLQENLNLIEVNDLKEDTKVWLAFARVSLNYCDRMTAINNALRANGENFNSVLNSEQGADILIMFAKVNKDVNKCIDALRAVFDSWNKSFYEIAEDARGKDALITFAKIPAPFLKDEQTSAIKAVIVSMGGISSEIAKNQQGMDALITFAKLSNNVHAKMNAVRTVLKSKTESFDIIAQDEQGVDLLLTFAKINMMQFRDKQIRALQSIFKAKGENFDEVAMDKQGRDALITYSKLSKNVDEQLKAMRAVFKARGRNFNSMAKDEQGVYALITFAQIPKACLHDEQMAAIIAVLEEKGNDYNVVAESSQGIDALIVFIKKSNNVKERISALAAIYRSSHSSDYHREITMLGNSISIFGTMMAN